MRALADMFLSNVSYITGIYVSTRKRKWKHQTLICAAQICRDEFVENVVNQPTDVTGK